MQRACLSKAKSKSVSHVEEEESEESDPCPSNDLSLCHVKSIGVKHPPPIKVTVKLDGRRRKCHQDHLRSRVMDDGAPETFQGDSDASFLVSGLAAASETTPQIAQKHNHGIF